MKRIYESFQFQPDKIKEDDFLKALSFCRLDARLCEIVIRFLVGHYQQLNPFEIYQGRNRLKTPQVLGVIGEFAWIWSQKRALRNWVQCATFDLEKAPLQRFFIFSGRPQPERDLQVFQRSLKPYSAWGFFESENLIPLKEKKAFQKVRLSKKNRGELLRQLLQGHRKITVNDYLKACEGMISRRTAERDLHSLKGIRSRGNTRSKVFFL